MLFQTLGVINMPLHLKFSLVVGMTFLFSCLLIRVIDMMFFEGCDPKFGCWGDLQFSLFYFGTWAVISTIAFVLVTAIARANNTLSFENYKTSTSIYIGIVLTLSFTTLPKWGFDIIGTVVTWFILSGILSIVVIKVIEYLKNGTT